VFPVPSPTGGLQFTGRALRLWEEGMSEDVHSLLLDDNKQECREWAEKAHASGDTEQYHACMRAAARYERYLKTHAAGWLNFQALAAAPCPAFVEGVFDALAAYEAGVPDVIATLGTVLNPEWVPRHIDTAIIAFDGDNAGQDKGEAAARALYERGIDILWCPAPAADGLGKDWSERYRRAGGAGVAALLENVPRSYCTECLELAAYEAHGLMYCEAHYNKPFTLIIDPAGIDACNLALQPGAYVLDLETTGLDPDTCKVITVACGSPGAVKIIDTRRYYDAAPDERARWQTSMQALLQRDDITWIGHNIKFDWRFLACHFAVQLRSVEDTMIIERLLCNGEKVSAAMQATAERYGIAVTKEERAWFPDLDTRPLEWAAPLPSAQLAYIVQDIEVPHQLRTLQEEAIERAGLAGVVSLENAALPAIAAMEQRGITVDVGSWRAIIAEKRARHAELERAIQAILRPALAAAQAAQQLALFDEDTTASAASLNLASPSQLRAALAACGVDVEKTDSAALEGVKTAHAVIPLLLEWKDLEKVLSAFGESILSKVRPDGRIHATFDQLGAESGRIICRTPNLQQIPKPEQDGADLRACFVAAPGHKLLIADLSNIELRILAEVAQDTTMLGFFAEGKDLHAETARLMFNLAPDVDTKKHYINGTQARAIAKTINFGLAYGMGAPGLARSVGVSIEDAKQLMASYFRTYAGLDRYLRRSGRDALKRGYAASLSGRRRSFSTGGGVVDSALYGRYERAAKNHPIQGSNADILKRALALLWQRLPQEVYIVLSVHDEIVLEAPAALVEDARACLQACMVDACRFFLKVVAIEVPKVLVEGFWAKD
jgi:DNA polymerase-1